MLTKQDVFDMLQKFGISHSDTVLMHTSLKAIGEIEGGAEKMLDAFCEYLYDGLYIVPTQTWGYIGRDNPCFDVRQSMPSIGTYPTLCAKAVFKKENAARSLHCTHSVAVFGKGAAEFVKGESEQNSRTSSLWHRLYDAKAKILLVGVGQEKNTYIHAIDEEVNGPRATPPFTARITDADGNTVLQRMLYCNGWWKAENFHKFDPLLKYCGAENEGVLGCARVICCDAAKTHDAVIALCKNQTDRKNFIKGDVPETL